MDGYAFDDVAHDRLALVTWNAIWVGAEAHMSPHRYEVTTYSWSGNAFRKATSQTTVQKYTWMHDAKAQPISPLSDPALTLLTGFSDPHPANWDRRFQLRQTGWDPAIRNKPRRGRGDSKNVRNCFIAAKTGRSGIPPTRSSGRRSVRVPSVRF
jgi:hypothetical protein